MKFVEFNESYLDSYRDFQRKIGNDDHLPVMLFSYYQPSPDITIKKYLIVDDNIDSLHVVGAVDIKLQNYMIAGKLVQIAAAIYPVSLGIVDARYAMVALFLFKKLSEIHPFNYLLGMGPPARNVVARLTEMLGWTLRPIPYLFMPLRLGPLAEKQVASRPALAAIVRVAHRLRLFWPVDAILRVIRRGRGSGLRVKRVARFDGALDEFWQAYSKGISFSLVRDSAQINSMFPDCIMEFEKLALYAGGRLVGFSVLLVPTAENARRFAGIRVATLVEFCILDEDIENAAAALRAYLSDKDLDAVIVNASHGHTLRILKTCGFFERATNMYLATSKTLQALLDERNICLNDMVITRTDGDGPIGLGVDLT